MKKFLGLISIFILITILFTGCQKEVIGSQGIQNDATVQITTEKSNYKSSIEKIKITIINKGDTSIEYGSNYALKRNIDGNWVDIPYKKNSAFDTLLHTLNPKEKDDETVYLNMFDFTLSTGRYRVVKFFSSKEKEKFNVSCDFNIN